MQATTRLHDPILDVLPPQPQFVLDDPTPLHTANDMFDPHPYARNPTVLRFLGWR